jgi:hypothetical protein
MGRGLNFILGLFSRLLLGDPRFVFALAMRDTREPIADHSEVYSSSRSKISRTAGFAAGEFLFSVLMTLSSQEIESPGIPTRFSYAAASSTKLIGLFCGKTSCGIRQAMFASHSSPRRTACNTNLRVSTLAVLVQQRQIVNDLEDLKACINYSSSFIT